MMEQESCVDISPNVQGIVLITGASTGIGRVSTFHLAHSGYHVFAGVRRDEDAQSIIDEAQQKNVLQKVTPVLLDICKPDQVEACHSLVKASMAQANIKYMKALVNNAGIALGGPLLELPLDTLRTQFEVNVVGQLAMIQTFAPLLGPINDQSNIASSLPLAGKVIQISSISGVRSMPFLGPYSASKFALEGLSDALRMELLPYGIDVVIIQPGPIKTAIWDKAPTPDHSPYQNSPYFNALRKFYTFFVEGGKEGLDAIEIAKIIKKSIEKKKAAARYVKTQGLLLRYWLPKLLPTRTFDKKIGDLLGLNPKKFHRDE